jgi:hypothetical protein
LAITIAQRLPAVPLTTLSLLPHATLTQSSLQHLCTTTTGKGKGKAKAKAVSKAAATAAAAARAQAQADALQLDKEYKAALEPVRLEILPLLETSGRSSTLLMTGAKAAGPGGMCDSPYSILSICISADYTTVLVVLLLIVACYPVCVWCESCELAVTASDVSVTKDVLVSGVVAVVGAESRDDARQQLYDNIYYLARSLC